MTPIVSILITAYNREQYLADAIESVINSSYKNLEIIIVDDASTDRTVGIAKKYEKKDSRIKVYVNQKNLGDYPNRNRAASYANGEFIMWVDSDDIIYKESIEKCVYLMMQHPEVNFGTHYRIPTSSEPFVLDSATALYKHFFEIPYLMIGPGGTIIKRNYFNQIGGFPEKYGPACDMYFNLKAVRYSDTLMIPWEIFYLRRHEGQQSLNSFSYLYNNYLYNMDSFNELNLPFDEKFTRWLHKKNKRRFVNNIIKYFLKTKNLKKTKEAIHKAGFTLNDLLVGVFH